MIVTFTKLLVINIVANKRSELASKSLIFSSDGWIRESIWLLSDGVREKKAISEAEAKPETRSNIPAKIIATTADAVGEFTVKPLKKTANWHK